LPYDTPFFFCQNSHSATLLRSATLFITELIGRGLDLADKNNT